MILAHVEQTTPPYTKQDIQYLIDSKTLRTNRYINRATALRNKYKTPDSNKIFDRLQREMQWDAGTTQLTDYVTNYISTRSERDTDITVRFLTSILFDSPKESDYWIALRENILTQLGEDVTNIPKEVLNNAANKNAWEGPLVQIHTEIVGNLPLYFIKGKIRTENAEFVTKLNCGFSERETENRMGIELLRKALSIEAVKTEEAEKIEPTTDRDYIHDLVALSSISPRLGKPVYRAIYTSRNARDVTAYELEIELDGIKYISKLKFQKSAENTKQTLTNNFLKWTNLLNQAIEAGDTVIDFPVKHLKNELEKEHKPSPVYASKKMEDNSYLAVCVLENKENEYTYYSGRGNTDRKASEIATLNAIRERKNKEYK